MKKFLTVTGIILGLILATTIYKIAQTNQHTTDKLTINQITTKTQTTGDSSANIFTPSTYKNCEIYSRSNMNIPPYNKSFYDKSEVKCDLNGTNTILFEIKDKANFEDAKNSIYQFWKDTDGYKALIVDQNGAGSGEGNGKIILLQNKGYKLISGFYYTWEDFHSTDNEPQTTNEPPTQQELETIKKNTIATTSSYCSNFTLNSYLQ